MLHNMLLQVMNNWKSRRPNISTEKGQTSSFGWINIKIFIKSKWAKRWNWVSKIDPNLDQIQQAKGRIETGFQIFPLNRKYQDSSLENQVQNIGRWGGVRLRILQIKKKKIVVYLNFFEKHCHKIYLNQVVTLFSTSLTDKWFSQVFFPCRDSIKINHSC